MSSEYTTLHVMNSMNLSEAPQYKHCVYKATEYEQLVNIAMRYEWYVGKGTPTI